MFFKKHWFKFLLLAVALISAIVVWVLLGSLWSTMEEYEYASETGAVADYFNRFAQGDYDTAADTSGFPFTERATREDYIRYLKETFGSDFSRLRFAGRDGEVEGERLYNIYVDTTLLGTLRLIPEEFEGRAWKPVAVVEYAEPVKVLVPSYASVTVNGVESLASDRTEVASVQDEDFKPLEYLLSVPTKDTYVISGFLFSPEVFAYVPDGTVCRKEVAEDGTIIFTVPETAEQTEPFKTMMQEFSFGYAKWIAKDGKFSAFDDYLDPATKFYQDLKKFDNYWFTAHDGYEFRNVAVSDFSRPAEGLFAGTFIFDHVVFYQGEEIVYHTTYRLLYRNVDGEWLLAGLTIL